MTNLEILDFITLAVKKYGDISISDPTCRDIEYESDILDMYQVYAGIEKTSRSGPFNNFVQEQLGVGKTLEEALENSYNFIKNKE